MQATFINEPASISSLEKMHHEKEHDKKGFLGKMAEIAAKHDKGNIDKINDHTRIEEHHFERIRPEEHPWRRFHPSPREDHYRYFKLCYFSKGHDQDRHPWHPRNRHFMRFPIPFILFKSGDNDNDEQLLSLFLEMILKMLSSSSNS